MACPKVQFQTLPGISWLWQESRKRHKGRGAMRSVAALSTHALEGRPTLGYEPGPQLALDFLSSMEDEGMLCHGEGQSAESQLRGQICCASGSELPPVQVLLCSAQGEGANQWKDERIRQVAATCCLHVVALIALPKPVRDVCECTFGWPPRQLDGVRIVPIRHSLRFLVCWHGGRRLSVAMGNLSLKYIYPSFNQMLGPALTPRWAVVVTSRPELEQADKQPRIHVATDHSTPGRGDAAEAFSAEDVAVHAGHLCWLQFAARRRLG